MTMFESRYRWFRLAAAAVLAAATVPAVSAGPAGAVSAPADAPDTIVVDPAHPFGALPGDFVGLSYEMRELATRCKTGVCAGGFDATRGNLVTLLRNFGRSNVRIAGNQLDRDTLWVPAGQTPPDPLPTWVQDVVTPADITRLDGVLRATGWKAEVGVNLAHYDAALAADEGHVLTSALGSRLAGVECGNEPNHYAGNGYRPAPYGFAEHRTDWEACLAQLGPARIAAPDLSSPKSTGDWFGQFAAAEKDRIDMLTAHNYTGATTIEQLLSPQIRASELSDVSAQLAAAKSVGVPIRLDETNSAVGGGIAGVSDVYASSLWAMDYSLTLAQAGFAGVNLHGGFGICGAPLYNGKFQLYTPLCAANDQDLRAKVYRAMPEYYGLYMASRMGSGHFLPITVSSQHNITAYAVRGDDGRLRVAVIDKEPTTAAAASISLQTGVTTRDASILRLTGTSLDSADGVAVQGSTVDRAGHLRPGPAEQVPVRHGTVRLTVPAGSALILTLDDCA